MEKSSDQEIGKAFSAPVDVQLPTPGVGYYSYQGGPVPLEDSQYGTQNTINAVIAIGTRWNQPPHPAGRIGVGDISLRGGGPMPGHTTGHRLGLNVDMRPMRTDLFELPTNINDTANYNRDYTRELLQEIHAQGNIRRIYFNDSVLIGEGLCQQLAGHDDHLHVEFL